MKKKFYKISGLWGLIAAGLFKTEGLMSSGSVTILIWNSIGAAIIIAWHAVCGSIMFFVLKKLGLFRIAAKLEESGLDVPYHDEPAYIFTSRKGKYTSIHDFQFHEKFREKKV